MIANRYLDLVYGFWGPAIASVGCFRFAVFRGSFGNGPWSHQDTPRTLEPDPKPEALVALGQSQTASAPADGKPTVMFTSSVSV